MNGRVASAKSVEIDPQRSLAAKFAVMHNSAQTAMLRSVEPGQSNETVGWQDFQLGWRQLGRRWHAAHPVCYRAPGSRRP